MKVKSLIIQNIGMISEETIEFDKPLILFYGDIKQGKTTILNAVRWAMGGSFPADIIKHGTTEALIELTFDNGSVERSFYINKEGVTVSRPQKIVLNGKICQVTDLKKFLNPFLLKQSYLSDMNEGDRVKFLIELFNIDTADLDLKISEKEKQASELRAKIKGYGEIVLTEIVKPDMDKLNKTKADIQAKINAEKQTVEISNQKLKAEYNAKKQTALNEIADFNSLQKDKSTAIQSATKTLENILQYVTGSIFEKCFDDNLANKTIGLLPQPEPEKPLIVDIPEPQYHLVDDTELSIIDQNIHDAKLLQVKYDQYLIDKKRFDAKEIDQNTLKITESAINILRKEKLTKQSEINGKIEGLEASETGIKYEGTSFNMLSTSQLMKLSSELSAMYPEGFGIELIDRGESLGKSIFDFVAKAERESKTILATIVGEKPANVPENIGVFVVENGILK